MKKNTLFLLIILFSAVTAFAVWFFVFKKDFVDYPTPFEFGYFEPAGDFLAIGEEFGIQVQVKESKLADYYQDEGYIQRVFFISNLSVDKPAYIEILAETNIVFPQTIARPASGIIHLEAGEMTPLHLFYYPASAEDFNKLEETLLLKVYRPGDEFVGEINLTLISEVKKAQPKEKQLFDFMAEEESTGKYEGLFKKASTEKNWPEINENGFLVMTSPSGETFWEYDLGGKTEVVDVPSDNSFIVTTRQAPVDPDERFIWGNTAVVLDNKGTLVMEFVFPPTGFWWGKEFGDVSAVKFLPDKKYLFVGDDIGRLIVVDVEQKKIAWEKFLRGKIETIFIDNNFGNIFVDSDDGYLRSFDYDGNLVWQTWVDGSLAGIDASKKYIVAKSGIPGSPLHLLRKKNGKTLFSLPVEHGGSEIKISENEKYIWYGEESGSPKGAMLTIEGRSVKDY